MASQSFQQPYKELFNQINFPYLSFFFIFTNIKQCATQIFTAAVIYVKLAVVPHSAHHYDRKSTRALTISREIKSFCGYLRELWNAHHQKRKPIGDNSLSSLKQCFAFHKHSCEENCAFSSFKEKQEVEDLYYFDELCVLQNVSYLSQNLPMNFLLWDQHFCQISGRQR